MYIKICLFSLIINVIEDGPHSIKFLSIRTVILKVQAHTKYFIGQFNIQLDCNTVLKKYISKSPPV